MGVLSQLLRWKRELILKDAEGKELRKVWLRIISDYDLQESYKLARIASAEKRAKLRDVDSTDFKDQIKSFGEASIEECKDLIRAARENTWGSQALSTVVRGEEVRISEVAVDPDAPTLEEQEKLDSANKEVDEKYTKGLEEFIETKRRELDAQLEGLDVDELRLLAQAEATVLLPLTVFMNELIEQKAWRAVYTDKEFTEHGFDSIEDFRQTKEILRNQIIEAYAELEAGAEDIKN